MKAAIIVYVQAQHDNPEQEHSPTEAQITDAVEGKTVYKRTGLRALVEEGQLVREGEGGRRDPFRYRPPP